MVYQQTITFYQRQRSTEYKYFQILVLKLVLSVQGGQSLTSGTDERPNKDENNSTFTTSTICNIIDKFLSSVSSPFILNSHIDTKPCITFMSTINAADTESKFHRF